MVRLKLRMRKTLFSLISVLIISVSGFSQMEKYSVKVNMDDNFASMDGAFAIVKVNGQKVKRIAASSSGKLEFDLEFGQDYVVEFHKQFYATKKINVFLGQVTSEMIDIGCYGNTWHVGMIQKVEGIDYSVLDAAVGEIFFEPERKCFGWDADYSLRVMEELERLEEELAAKKDEFESALSNAAKAISKGDFARARTSLATAQKLFPHDIRIEELKKDIDKAAAAAKNAELADAAAAEAKQKKAEEKAKNEEFNELMSAGDKALKSGDFEAAKAKYVAAGKVNPESTAVKTKLQVIEDTVVKRAAEREAEKLVKEEEARQAEAALATAAAAKIAEEAKEAEESAAATAATEADEAKAIAEKEAAMKQKEADEQAKIAAKEEENQQKAKEKAAAEKLKEESTAASSAEKESADASKAEAKAAVSKEKEKALAAEAEAKKTEEEKKGKEKEAEQLASQAEKDAKTAEKEKAVESKKLEEEAEGIKAAAEKAEKEKEQKATSAAIAEKEEKKKPETKTSATVVAKEPVTPPKKAVTNTVKQENDKRKAEMHGSSKKTSQPENKHADILAKLNQAGLEQNPKSSSIEEHHEWDMGQPGVSKEIAKEYPEGVTEEVYMKGNKEITERVVVRDGRGDIFWKVTHPWGGIYYFKNNTTNISSYEFDLFTTIKDEDGNVIEPYHIDRVQNHDH